MAKKKRKTKNNTIKQTKKKRKEKHTVGAKERDTKEEAAIASEGIKVWQQKRQEEKKL